MQIHGRTSNKQKITLIIFGIFLCGVLLEGGLRIGGLLLLSQQNSNPIEQKGTYHILCLGESTTFYGNYYSYPRQLERILNQQNSGIKFRVTNKGIPGTNSTRIVEKLEVNINKYNPDMIIVMMGINDDEYTVSYADIHSNKTILFFKSFRIYKLAKLLRLHISHRFKEIEFVEAEETLKKALEIDPKNDRAYIGLAQYYRRQNKKIEAEETLKRALEINPENDRAYVDLASYYWWQGKKVETEKLFKKAIEINPENDKAYVDLARYYWWQGKKIETEELLKRALEINPQNDDAYPELAYYYRVQGKSAEAGELLKKAIEINPENEKAYIGLAYYYEGMKRMVEAEKMHKKALEIDPKNYKAYVDLAKNYRKHGKFDEAEETYKKALEVFSKNNVAYADLAYYLGGQEKKDEAREMYKITLEINPKNDAINYNLQTLLYKKNKNRKIADGYSQEINRINAEWYKPATIQNYQMLKKTVTKKGVKLVPMQYPIRSVQPLKDIFKDKEGLVFVDNEQIFKEAVARENYEEYFIDKLGMDFGHYTAKGYELLAENAANVILKEFF